MPLLPVGISLAMTLVAFEQASALTVEQAREQCRETIGRPIVQACMRSHGYGGGGGRGFGRGFGRGRGMGGGGGDPQKEADREACRARARPQVHACVQKALNAANGRANVPIAMPVEKSDDAPDLDALPATFVAPPRTINDITTLIDSEKPDPSRIDQLKAAAEKQPPVGGSRQDLGWFYYTRGNARARLGRLNEAIADANKAIDVARGSVDANFIGRLEQFAALQYSAAGNPKQALAVFSGQVRDTNANGARGHMFSSNVQISRILIQMGDLEQADAYLRRNLALIQEARTSGMPGWRTSYITLGQSWEAHVELHRGIMFEARGQFREAENSYRVAEQRQRASI